MITENELNTVLLNKIADYLQKNPNGMMRSRWKKDEAEEIARKTIISCRDNLAKNEDAFIWVKPTQNNGCPVTNNYATGLRILTSEGSVIIEDYNGNLTPPANTTHKNEMPQVLRVTNKLLEYAEQLIGL